MMGEEKFQQDIDNLYSKTNGIDKELVEIKINQKHYTETLEKVAESNMKLVDTLQSMQITFVKIDGKIDEMSKAIADTKEDITDTKEQVYTIDNRMKKIEEDGNFNIMQFLKKNLHWIIVGIGAIALWASDKIKY